jgi:ribosomal-protein-alanine N-acetyltransferase
MNVVIETDRLLLRIFTIDDAPLLYELNSDAYVTRYTGDPMKNVEHAQQVLEEIILPQYTLYNYGRWSVHKKPGHEFIGWCGLKYVPARNEVDLGYRFKKSEWGNGFATEAAHATIKYGFDRLHLSRIIGRAMPQNTGSLKVLKKLGMSYVSEGIIDGHAAITYEIINPLIR